MAMEDFRVDVIVGKGPGATAIPLELPPFTLVGATTRAGLLPPPLRDRFGFTGAHGVLRARGAGARHPPLRAAPRRRHRGGGRRRDRRPLPRHPVSPTACCAASATTPRSRHGRSPARWPPPPCGVRGRRPRLDRLDRARAPALLALFGGGPVGLSTLAVAVGEERETVEEVAEPFWSGRDCCPDTPRGRVATPAAWAHLGLVPSAAGPPAPKRTTGGCSGRDGASLAGARNHGGDAGRRSNDADSLRLRRCRPYLGSAYPPPR